MPLSILFGTSVSSQYQHRVFLYVVDAMIIQSVLPRGTIQHDICGSLHPSAILTYKARAT